MGVQSTDRAVLICSFGVASSMLNVVVPTVAAGSMPAINILDTAPIVNIMPFGMCITPSNPEVAAALGVLTPMPRIPVTKVWAPGVPTLLLRGAPAAADTCMCMCNGGGVITPLFPGQMEVVDG
jgi:hypothetical protein